MKRKTYLRGLGLGLIVAALVTGVGSRQTMSDEQVKARAKELGMTESKTYLTQMAETEEMMEAPGKEGAEETVEVQPELTVESELTETAEPIAETETETETAEETASETKETQESVTETVEAANEEMAEAAAEETVSSSQETIEETQESQTAETEETAKSEEASQAKEGAITIQVYRGDSSVSVAKRVAQAGLVEDAMEFDRYLCQNGYDKKIRVGVYELWDDFSEQEIAETITRGEKQ